MNTSCSVWRLQFSEEMLFPSWARWGTLDKTFWGSMSLIIMIQVDVNFSVVVSKIVPKKEICPSLYLLSPFWYLLNGLHSGNDPLKIQAGEKPRWNILHGNEALDVEGEL